MSTPADVAVAPVPEAELASKKPRRLSEIKAFSTSTVPEREGSFHSEDAPICWICLDTHRPDRELIHPCKCPRMAHPNCLARWQLQSAGSRKETHCEFCDARLPDWKATLTPQCGANAPAVMNVNFDGRTYSFEVKPGPDGYKQFTEAIRRAFALPDDSELNITFTCDEPSTGLMHSGALLTLQGAGAYDAAVHCASVSAARRSLAARAANSEPGTPGAASGVYRHFDHTGSPISPLGAASPSSSSGASSSAPGSPEQPGAPGTPGPKRRPLLRKLRTALCDMLSINPRP